MGKSHILRYSGITLRADSTTSIQANSASGRRSYLAKADMTPLVGPYCLTPAQRFCKRAMDLFGACVLLMLFAPLYLMVALAVRGGMGGPVHFWQVRLGEGGRTFRFYKFRSMKINSDAILEKHLAQNAAAKEEWDRYQKLEKDPRVTLVGRIIRKVSLDELPQLFNVIKGEMSLVGPRPCMVRQRILYGDSWRHYCHVRPGITGLWQVSGRNRLSYADRVALDTLYTAEWSLWLDLKILVRTVRVVLTGDGSS